MFFSDFIFRVLHEVLLNLHVFFFWKNQACQKCEANRQTNRQREEVIHSTIHHARLQDPSPWNVTTLDYIYFIFFFLIPFKCKPPSQKDESAKFGTDDRLPSVVPVGCDYTCGNNTDNNTKLLWQLQQQQQQQQQSTRACKSLLISHL